MFRKEEGRKNVASSPNNFHNGFENHGPGQRYGGSDSEQKIGIRGQGGRGGSSQRFSLLECRAGLKPWEHWVPFSDGPEPEQPRDYFCSRHSSWS